MRQRNRIMKQCIEKMPAGPVVSDDNKVVPPRRGEMKSSMEALIHHFKLLHRRLSRARRRGLCGRRGAEGRIWRLSGIRRLQQALSLQDPRAKLSPILQALDALCRGHMLADVAAILGSIDVVFGEVDR